MAKWCVEQCLCVRSLILVSMMVTNCMSIACSDVEGVTDLMWNRISQWYRTARISEFDEGSIPETPVQYAGEIGLELKGRVELALDENTPGIGFIAMKQALITPDSSLIFIDMSSGQVHEFSVQDGRYIRSFGRRGEGLGEYRKALFIALGPEGYVYVCDSIGQVVCYNRQGHYIDKSVELYSSSEGLSTGLFAILGGDLLSLFVDQNTKVLKMQKITKVSWKVKYEVPLSIGKYSSIRIFPSVWARYDITSNRLYYLGPNEYKIKEVDTSTGKVIRRFGWQPPGFIPLSDKYYNADVDKMNPEKIREKISSISLVTDLNVLSSKYVYINYHGLQNTDKAYCIIYDIEATDTVKAYSLDRPIGSTTVSQERLYLYRSPSEEAYDISNGTVEIHALSPIEK